MFRKTDVLPNGAVVCDSACVKGTIVYLATWPKWNGDEYITWLANLSTPGETYWGHYFDTREEARKDFYNRFKDLLGTV